jgi:hypothetical protein
LKPSSDVEKFAVKTLLASFAEENAEKGSYLSKILNDVGDKTLVGGVVELRRTSDFTVHDIELTGADKAKGIIEMKRVSFKGVYRHCAKRDGGWEDWTPWKSPSREDGAVWRIFLKRDGTGWSLVVHDGERPAAFSMCSVNPIEDLGKLFIITKLEPIQEDFLVGSKVPERKK